jgi:hypothetical protein
MKRIMIFPFFLVNPENILELMNKTAHNKEQKMTINATPCSWADELLALPKIFFLEHACSTSYHGR